MAAKFYSGIDLCNTELLRAKLQNLSAAPTTAGSGMLYFDVSASNNTSKRALVYTGSAWKVFAYKDDIESALASYATLASFNTLNTKVTGIDERLEDIESFFATSDSDNLINKWHEIVDFLNATEGDTLSGVLATYAKDSELTKAVNRISALETTISTEQGHIDTLQGYFTNGAANKAIADGNGNNIANTYATNAALNITNVNVTANAKAISELQTKMDSIYGWYESVGQHFKYDSDEKAWYLDGDFYTKGENSAGGPGTEIGATGGGGSDVTFTPSFTSGTKLGELKIDGITSTIYSPSTLPNPKALTFGTKSYDGSVARAITASDIGAISDAAGIKAAIGFDVARKVVGTVVAGGALSQTITHNLGTRNVTVQLFTPGTPYEQVYADVRVTSTNAVTIAFAEAPIYAYKVVIIG